MAEDDPDKGKLPGNQGQFGVNNATEEHKTLEDHPSPEPPASEAPTPTTDAKETA